MQNAISQWDELDKYFYHKQGHKLVEAFFDAIAHAKFNSLTLESYLVPGQH